MKRDTSNMVDVYKQKMVEEQLFCAQRDTPFTWKDIKHLDLQDDDIINLCWVDSFYSENNSWEGHFEAEVIRMVPENDEQYKSRISAYERSKTNSKKQRYENYLKLKEEFDDKNISKENLDGNEK